MVKRRNRPLKTVKEVRNRIISNMQRVPLNSMAKRVIQHVRADNLTVDALMSYVIVMFNCGVVQGMNGEKVEDDDSVQRRLEREPKMVVVNKDQISPVTFLEWGDYALVSGWYLVHLMRKDPTMRASLKEFPKDFAYTKKETLLMGLMNAYEDAGGVEPKED